MENIRIGRRLLLGFGALVALTLALGVYALERHGALHDFTVQMSQRDVPVLQTVLTLITGEEHMRGLRVRALLSTVVRKERTVLDSPDALQRRWTQARDLNIRRLSELGTAAAQWQRAALTPQRSAGWRRISEGVAAASQAFSALGPEAESQFALLNSGDWAGAIERNSAVENAARSYEARLAELEQIIREQFLLGRQEVDAAGRDTRNSVLLVLVLSCVAGLALTWLIHRSIVHPMKEFGRLIEQVGRGDLSEHAPPARTDEIGDLGRSLGRMTSGLREVTTQTRSVVENLNSAISEILASTQEQAASTAEQAAAVQQANATMAQITRSGAQISDRAKQVAAAAEAASTASSVGMDSVRSTVTNMESIRQQAEAVAENVVTLSEKTQAIGEIIATVNDIAEQSHLLAVNAAIQAAAAGEHGRSFVVVASELKNLAAQSKQATVQVRSILGDIQKGITSSVLLTEEAVKRVETGRQQATVAERTIQELTENIEESIRAFQQIVGGSGQQQIGFEQVTQAFRSIGTASQETATSTKQLEKAAANLNTLAIELREAIARYRL